MIPLVARQSPRLSGKLTVKGSDICVLLREAFREDCAQEKELNIATIHCFLFFLPIMRQWKRRKIINSSLNFWIVYSEDELWIISILGRNMKIKDLLTFSLIQLFLKTGKRSIFVFILRTLTCGQRRQN